jgi:hypothetical protein
MIEDQYWKESARQLAEIFSCIPGFQLSDLGDDAQKFLAAYVPVVKAWDERIESLRAAYVKKGATEFKTIYDAYLENYTV